MVKYVAYNIFKGVIETPYHLGHSFKKLHFLLDQTMNRNLQALDVTSAQAHAIGYLTHSPCAPCARDLESAHGLSHATVSGILGRMEAKAFIEVRPDPRDRRVKRIYLLERGEACSKEIELRINECEQQLARGFTDEELLLFRSFLSRAIRNLSEPAQESTTFREE